MDTLTPPDADAPGPTPGSTAALAAQLFAQKSEAELLYLARNAHRYPPAVGAAAVAELQRRGAMPELTRTAPAAPAEDETWGAFFRHVVRNLFVPSRKFLATPILLQLNLLVFALMVLSGVSAQDPSPQDLVRWGSNVTSRTLDGEPWRLLSHQFLHAGVSHLLLNLLSLWLLGVLIEARVRPLRMALVYLACGVGGGLASLWYHSAGVNSVGASGAIFGLYGFMLALLVSKRIALGKSDRRAMLGLVLYLVLSNLISGLSGNIDNAAHIGGLVTGMFVAGPLALLGLRRSVGNSKD